VNRVWKFELTPGTYPQMPEHAQLLHVGAQNRRLVVWALCAPEAELVERRLLIVGTGHDVPELPGDHWREHVGTAIGVEGDLVIHVFEDREMPF
jgi:hypothetical protein